MIYIGYDKREHLAAEVCRWSIARHSPDQDVRMLKLSDPDVEAVFKRPYYLEEGQFFDVRSAAPFSTEFSFSRFLVPYLSQYEGWHLFVDADFLFRAPLEPLFELADDKYAVMVVHHKYRPPETVKMDGVVQTRYKRKNWSSLVLWNCSHPANAVITPDYVAHANGLSLHGFRWLKDEEIGAIPVEWNYLIGHNTAAQCPNPRAVHFTLGGPWFGAKYDGVEYADEWKQASAAYVAQ